MLSNKYACGATGAGTIISTWTVIKWITHAFTGYSYVPSAFTASKLFVSLIVTSPHYALDAHWITSCPIHVHE